MQLPALHRPSMARRAAEALAPEGREEAMDVDRQERARDWVRQAPLQVHPYARSPGGYSVALKASDGRST